MRLLLILGLMFRIFVVLIENYTRKTEYDILKPNSSWLFCKKIAWSDVGCPPVFCFISSIELTKILDLQPSNWICVKCFDYPDKQHFFGLIEGGEYVLNSGTSNKMFVF